MILFIIIIIILHRISGKWHTCATRVVFVVLGISCQISFLRKKKKKVNVTKTLN